MVNEMESDKDVVLNAASELFERYGYKKTTIDDIAAEAGIGKGSVYLRFSSKEELGLAWLQKIHHDLFEGITELDPVSTVQDKVHRFLVNRVMQRFDIFVRHRRSLDEALCSLRSSLDERKRAMHEREAVFVSALITEGIDQGVFSSTDPLADARTMVLATNSLLPYSYRSDQVCDRDTVLAQANDLAALLVRALEKRNG